MELSKTLKYGEKLGLDELEIFVHITDVIDVEGELGEISKTNKAKETDNAKYILPITFLLVFLLKHLIIFNLKNKYRINRLRLTFKKK